VTHGPGDGSQGHAWGAHADLRPPDPGLQAERTSLAWTRTWAVVAADILLVAKLAAESSLVLAGAFSLAGVVPLVGLVAVRGRHERRVRRFRRAGEVTQFDARDNLALVVVVGVMATTGLVAVLGRALG